MLRHLINLQTLYPLVLSFQISLFYVYNKALFWNEEKESFCAEVNQNCSPKLNSTWKIRGFTLTADDSNYFRKLKSIDFAEKICLVFCTVNVALLKCYNADYI